MWECLQVPSCRAGELGLPIIESLCTHPQRKENASVTVLLRGDATQDPNPTNPKRHRLATTIEAKGAHVIFGNLDEESEDELALVFAGYSHIVGASGMYYSEGTQLKIAKAVLRADVDRYFPWQYGMDYDVIGRGSPQELFDEQLDVRDLLRSQSKTQWVIVSTGLFMPFLFNPAFGVVGEGKRHITALGSWDNEITVTMPDDIGKTIAELIWVDTDIQGVVYIAGETATYEKVARHIEKSIGSVIKRELATIEQLEAERVADPWNEMKRYRATFAHGKGVAWTMEKAYNVRKGMKFRDISQYLTEEMERELDAM